jgi:hypothetical protein
VDASELSPSMRSTLNQLEDDIASDTTTLAERAHEIADAEKQVKVAKAAVLQPWQKTQIYWTKGVDTTVDGMLAARAAGLPIQGVLRLYDPSKEQIVENTTQNLVAQVQHRQQAAGWDDPILEVAVVHVPIGQAGTPFTRSPPGTAPEEPSGVSPVTGAPEMQAALCLLEQAACKHATWKQQQTLYNLQHGTGDQHTYTRLLDSVPREQVSVPVIMHCMLEQVARSVLGPSDGADEAVLEATRRFKAIMQQSLTLDLTVKEKGKDMHETYTVMEGDTADMAAHGILSGYIRPHCRSAIDRVLVPVIAISMLSTLALAYSITDISCPPCCTPFIALQV